MNALILLTVLFLNRMVESQTPQTPALCTSKIDLVFIVDQSGSICDTDPDFLYGRDATCNNYLNLLSFIKDSISSFTIGDDATRVGMVVFSSHAQVEWKLDSYNNTSDLLSAVDNLTHTGGFTDTAGGVRLARTQVFGNSGDRPQVLNVVIIITDGVPTVEIENLPSEISAMQSAGIVMFAVGVTNSIDENTLRSLSSPPQLVNHNYFLSSKFAEINTINNQLNVQVCVVVTTSHPNSTAAVTITLNGVSTTTNGMTSAFTTGISSTKTTTMATIPSGGHEMRKTTFIYSLLLYACLYELLCLFS